MCKKVCKFDKMVTRTDRLIGPGAWWWGACHGFAFGSWYRVSPPGITVLASQEYCMPPVIPPLPVLARSPDRMGEFSAAASLIASAQEAFAARSEMYTATVPDKLLAMGLRLGASACRVCSTLAASDPYWTCVCARAFLEFSLRLLWAARENNGSDRMYAHFAHEHRDWFSSLADQVQTFKKDFDEMERAAPISKLPARMPYKLTSVIQDIAKADKAEGVDSLYTEPGHYVQGVQFLHMYAHANPLFLDGDANAVLPHAAHAILDGTHALLRAVGYRLNWDQMTVVVRVFAVASLESLSEADLAELQASLEIPKV